MRPVGRWITRGRADMGGAAGWLGRQRPALAGWLLLRPRAAASLGSGGALHSRVQVYVIYVSCPDTIDAPRPILELQRGAFAPLKHAATATVR
eukprot:COSAG06_NODE_5529_length_3422_cov_48.261511_1_plen_92_part_10